MDVFGLIIGAPLAVLSFIIILYAALYLYKSVQLCSEHKSPKQSKIP